MPPMKRWRDPILPNYRRDAARLANATTQELIRRRPSPARIRCSFVLGRQQDAVVGVDARGGELTVPGDEDVVAFDAGEGVRFPRHVTVAVQDVLAVLVVVVAIAQTLVFGGT